MLPKVTIVGVGTTGFRATTPDVSYRELTYEAAVKAYLDAGVEPKDIFIGMRVQAVWRHEAERTGSITDIEYFKPIKQEG